MTYHGCHSGPQRIKKEKNVRAKLFVVLGKKKARGKGIVDAGSSLIHAFRTKYN